MQLKQALVYAILMENGDGIRVKSPAYVLEKLRACETVDDPSGLLDQENVRKLKEYLSRWNLKGT